MTMQDIQNKIARLENILTYMDDEQISDELQLAHAEACALELIYS